MGEKDNYTRERLLLLAKKEFQNRGFNKVSMRDISEVTGMALGNIYYYFKTKDELFTTILSPLLREFEKVIAQHNDVESIKGDVFKLTEFNEHSWHFFDLIKKNKEDLFLLFYMSQGSSLEHYSEYLLDTFTDMGMRYVNNYRAYHHKEDICIDTIFMRVYSTMVIISIKEMVRHDKIPKEDFKRFSKNISTFAANGWSGLMRA